jgi:hypothetical protein
LTDKPKRRIRVRRRHKSDLGDDAGDAVVEFGCCLFEVVAAASVLAALLAIPAVMLVN